jgi:ADP-heptose:LPS heptosyltransferase
MMQVASGEVVLAIRPRALGDVVLVTPALRALRRGHPAARLEVVTEPRYAALVGALPEVDQVWTMTRGATDTLRLAAALRRRPVALAVDFFGNPRTALLARACGAGRRAGYALRGRGRTYHVRVPRTLPPAPGREEFAAATHVRLAVAAGGTSDGVLPRIAVPPAAQAAARERLAGAGVHAPERTIGLVAAGTWGTKTWPVAFAAGLARRLQAHGHAVLLLAGPGEERVTAAMTALAPGLCVLPPCDVITLAGVVARLGAVVGNDSGPRHLAAALDVPSFGWFGPTQPEVWTTPDPRHGTWWSPVPCRGCNRTACPHWNCMPLLTPDRAAALVTAHLATQWGGTPAAASGAA